MWSTWFILRLDSSEKYRDGETEKEGRAAGGVEQDPDIDDEQTQGQEAGSGAQTQRKRGSKVRRPESLESEEGRRVIITPIDSREVINDMSGAKPDGKNMDRLLSITSISNHMTFTFDTTFPQ